MALILNIDTAIETAYLTLAKDGEVLVSISNDNQKDHAAWLQPAIQELMKVAGLDLRELNAIGISIGPGSYTGLRVGLSTAKGICYALRIPLITEVSLRLMAYSAIKYFEADNLLPRNLLFCPMIDARRMEVFTAIYDREMHEIVKPQSLVLTESVFEKRLGRQKILFLGNGSSKFQPLCRISSALFKEIPLSPIAIAMLTYKNFIGNNFADLAYTEPLYLKEFFVK
jgi:tRNA threonylcarbamoyladenosine biosynthesis protein TsaB